MRTKQFAFLLLAATAAFADRAADDAAWETIRIKQERPLLMETPLVSNGAAAAAIVPADGELWNNAAAKLQAAVAEKTGVKLPVVAPAKITDADWASRHLIVIGNLLNNPVFARLYFNYFACTDAAYTGNGGYELRSIHDPWGNGHNVIAVGAQDKAGVEAGVARLVALINERAKDGELKLGRLMELKFTKKGRRAPLEEKLTAKGIADRKEAIANIYARPGTERGAAHNTIKFAMLYHRTGDPGWLELYRDAMRQHINYYATNEYILQEGPRRYDRDFRDSWAYGMVIAWDLVEESPGWSDEERLKFTNHVLRMVWESNLYQNWDRESSVAKWRVFGSITHNHHTWPGLADLFGGWYFLRHYKLPVAKDWLDIALGMFRSCSLSSKPWEDSAGYQWIPQRHVLTYALASGDRTFIEQGHASQTGKALLQALDSLGRQPAWGDCGGFTSVSGMPELMCALEYATGDGRYRWAIEWLGADARDEMEAPFWTNVAPKRPDDLVGVAVTRLPKMHYDLFGRSGRSDIWQAPNLPFEETFDKLTLRSGWAEDDDYLMLDGTAAGSHGHLDGNCIIAFTAAGAQWLVDAEYIRRIPKYHCGVTVLRDGVSAIMPPSARLDEAVWTNNTARVRTTMPHYNGMTWTRNIEFVPKRHVTVIDELTAEQSGDYSLRCCWRVAGESMLDGDTLRTRQREKGFALRNLSGQRQELVYIKDFAGLPIHQLYQRQSARLRAGETVRFVNVFAASKDGLPNLDARDVASATKPKYAPMPAGAKPLRTLWRFADFPVTPRPLKVASIRSDPPPREAYSPLEKLIDGASGGSTTSCMFLAGKPVNIVLDLGTPQRVREVCVRSWEKLDGWGIKGLTLSVSDDNFQRDVRAAGELAATGTQTFGRNVNTIRTASLNQTARYVRITGEPATAKSVVYLAEIEVLGETPGEKAKLVALASADLDGDGKSETFVGTAGGEIVALSASGKRLWQTKVGSSVTALAAGKGLVVYGTDDAVLGVLAADGSKAAEVKPPMYRGVPSRVRNITLADLDGDGAREIVIGCDSWQYMAYSSALKLVWKTVYYAHGATVGHVADLDGDGKPEVIAGNAYYSLQILNHRGKVLSGRSGSFGPEQTAVTSGDLRGDGKRAAILGTDGGLVLAFDAKGGKLWETNVGDRVTTLHCDVVGGKPRVIAASESGYVWAFDASGKPIWKRDLGEPVKRLVRDGDGYVAAASANGIVRLSLDGKVEAVATTPAPVIDLVVSDGQATALMADGSALGVATR
ncbi:MAG: PQQ-binding-like beta-propeller repeat protein [Verrucomicrobia bacterium]|nr:PQQ-binding-like beta-propeller repeat protein [Verrucomicrobiota bacterium]